MNKLIQVMVFLTISIFILSGCNLTQLDTDFDGVADTYDDCQGFDDSEDADADGVPDGCDLCNLGDDNLDTDADGVPDACDSVAIVTIVVDSDVDGISDDGDGSTVVGDNLCINGATENCDDNCPYDANADQEDLDGNGIGDICQTQPDSDNDGILNDGDFSGLALDTPCIGGDVDNCDDNCPFQSNPLQADADYDGKGDLCDMESCHDGISNDGDALIDCADPDCQDALYGCEVTCWDLLDNDADGYFDCKDKDCDTVGYCEYLTELTCADSQDNDMDGLMDCADPDCFSAACPEVCGDTYDNDADGTTDCGDSDCFGGSCTEVCTNSQDNDGDGLIGCEDPDCFSVNCIEVCGDGHDNNYDGLVDSDASCPEICDDTYDNDLDGDLDCMDTDCNSVQGSDCWNQVMGDLTDVFASYSVYTTDVSQSCDAACADQGQICFGAEGYRDNYGGWDYHLYTGLLGGLDINVDCDKSSTVHKYNCRCVDPGDYTDLAIFEEPDLYDSATGEDCEATCINQGSECIYAEFNTDTAGSDDYVGLQLQCENVYDIGGRCQCVDTTTLTSVEQDFVTGLLAVNSKQLTTNDGYAETCNDACDYYGYDTCTAVELKEDSAGTFSDSTGVLKGGYACSTNPASHGIYSCRCIYNI
jgi:hypothetical protein